MRTKLGLLFAMLMVASVGGCGGSSKPTSYDCSAGLSAGLSDYSISGQFMALGDAPNALQLTRISAGQTSDLPIYGVWGQATTIDEDGVESTGDWDFEAGMVTLTWACAVSAAGHTPQTLMVTSTATYTSSTVTFLQNTNDDVTF